MDIESKGESLLKSTSSTLTLSPAAIRHDHDMNDSHTFQQSKLTSAASAPSLLTIGVTGRHSKNTIPSGQQHAHGKHSGSLRDLRNLRNATIKKKKEGLKVYFGKCACNTIEFKFWGDPIFSVYCHCDHCKCLFGAPFGVVAGVPPKRFIVTKGEDSLGLYNSSKDVVRNRCQNCGSPVFYSRTGQMEYTGFSLTLVKWGDKQESNMMRNIPAQFAPRVHAFYSKRNINFKDNLPKYVELPVGPNARLIPQQQIDEQHIQVYDITKHSMSDGAKALQVRLDKVIEQISIREISYKHESNKVSRHLQDLGRHICELEDGIKQANETIQNMRVKSEQSETLIKKLSKHSSRIHSSSVGLATSQKTLWHFDADFSRCERCSVTFWFIVRRHHCRRCGSVICFKCSAFARVPFYKGKVRVCIACPNRHRNSSVQFDDSFDIQDRFIFPARFQKQKSQRNQWRKMDD